MPKLKIPLAGIPPAGSTRFRFALLLLLPTLALTACGDGDEADVTIPAEPSNIAEAELLGYWVLTRENDRVPAQDRQIRYQFTAQGDFIRYVGAEVERSRYTFAAPDQLTVDGPSGTTFYDYQLNGDVLTLRVPGEGGGSHTLRKLADQNLEDVPPPASVPEEDSLPPDSM